MEHFVTTPQSFVEKIPSSEDINSALRTFKANSKNRKDLYERIRVLEDYLNLHHSDESGVDVFQVRMQIEDCWNKINNIFEPCESDDDEIRNKIASRENIATLARYGKANINDTERELRLKLIAREKSILHARSKHYALTTNLSEFKSSDEFPYPGYGVFGGDILDIKSVVDGARDVAIEGSIISPDVNDLIEKYNLSKIVIGEGASATTIIYNSKGLKKAREIADILESHDDMSEDPQTVFNFHNTLGKLVGINPKVCEKWSLKMALEIDPDFVPE